MSKNTLTKLIEKHQSCATDEPRNYVGASSIGSNCLRQIWYQFKGEKPEGVPAKFRRAGDIGKTLEGLIVSWLTEAGVQVERSDKTYYADNMPYFQGHFDGIYTYKKMHGILEIKTAKHSSFNIFLNKGLKTWDPQYYAQIQSYMGMSGINNAIILVLNKDNSELSDERVLFDANFYEKLTQKAAMIFGAKTMPPRIHGSALYFKCKMCKYNKVCHK